LVERLPVLLRFSVANFRSFWREQQLSMIASSLRDDPGGLIEVPALRKTATVGRNLRRERIG
jgi:hypothetical protein